ncbi:MAG: hypothetical protein ATN35_02385 [Epulopiscium sp. Nele67-Bin004]|nr:MAG: hypothetical protein ATN35_02385 [Epulopiscium sp. Nele67-Bin004]
MVPVVWLIYGLIIGSFLNVCIERIPKNQSIWYPASHCPKCRYVLKIKDLIPVLSYITLKGTCRCCANKISLQYIVVETVNGVVYMLIGLTYGFSLEALLMCVLFSAILVLSIIDMKHMLLPTKIIVFCGSLGIIIRLCISYNLGSVYPFLQACLGGVVGYALLSFIFCASSIFLKKEGMGFGDVRYLGMIGIFTSAYVAVYTLFIGCVIGSIYGIYQLYVTKESVPYPFGPFLTMGLIIAGLWL